MKNKFDHKEQEKNLLSESRRALQNQRQVDLLWTMKLNL